VFPEPEAMLTTTPKLLGIDGRKMSKSYDNAINLSDSPEILKKKVASMFTDPKRIRLSDKGHPEHCNVYTYYSIFVPEMKEAVYDWCTNAKVGCTECKKRLAQGLLEKLAPLHARRAELVQDKAVILNILKQGREKACDVAAATMKDVAAAMQML
ncbi:MAG: tryptophan--tRNA ligase, partial [Candidatus Omnitrophica bacterium]|nr:tryptophan--tRNA ligase [Candidatus Omnitrophota bacterium]